MYGALAGALAGRRIALDRDRFTATVEGRIAGRGKTIRIESITVHYDLAVAPEDRAAAERALHAHPRGCPVHESIGSAVPIGWDATLRVGDETVTLRGAE